MRTLQVWTLVLFLVSVGACTQKLKNPNLDDLDTIEPSTEENTETESGDDDDDDDDENNNNDGDDDDDDDNNDDDDNDDEEEEEEETSFMSEGDLIVTNAGNDTVLLLDSDGAYKNVVYDFQVSSESANGLYWMADTNEVAITIDGSDRVIAVSAETGESRVFLTNGNLNGTLRGLTRLVSGDWLIVESNSLERFTGDDLFRVEDSWPKVNIQKGAQQIDALEAGGFVLCSNNDDIVGIYDDDGSLVNSTTSGDGATPNGYGCIELDDGSIAVSWDGSSDFVAFYSSDLTTEDNTFVNAAVLKSPRLMTQKANGNILITDTTHDHLVEITALGVFERVLGGTVLNDPYAVLEVPNLD